MIMFCICNDCGSQTELDCNVHIGFLRGTQFEYLLSNPNFTEERFQNWWKVMWHNHQIAWCEDQDVIDRFGGDVAAYGGTYDEETMRMTNPTDLFLDEVDRYTQNGCVCPVCGSKNNRLR